MLKFLLFFLQGFIAALFKTVYYQNPPAVKIHPRSKSTNFVLFSFFINLFCNFFSLSMLPLGPNPYSRLVSDSRIWLSWFWSGWFWTRVDSDRWWILNVSRSVYITKFSLNWNHCFTVYTKPLYYIKSKSLTLGAYFGSCCFL